ncbi:telomere repeat binding factor-domain-containing protein [Xylariaceae sp. FL0016]|nr:telomere repeat binding factor-domain-containing protein [Xylariaceae sp. FL0016]
MVQDAEPRLPASPLKRSRSPQETNDDDLRGDKRLKIESDGDHDALDIAQLIRQAEESAMQHFQPTENPTPQDQPVTNDVFESTEKEPMSLDQNDLEAELAAAFAQQRPTPAEGDTQPRTDTLWRNPKEFTRRKHIIPALGSMAVDILIALSEQSLEDTIATFTGDPDSDITKEYGILKAEFDHQRGRLLTSAQKTEAVVPLFLDPESLKITRQAKEIIRIANLASTCASIFGSNEITLEEVNDRFLQIFVPENHGLPRDTAELYLGLKTQLCLSVLEGGQGKVDSDRLEEFLVTGLEKSLQDHHPHLPLTDIEVDFINSTKSRKAMLVAEATSIEKIRELGKQFTYEAFLDNLSTFLNDHIDTIKGQGSAEVEIATEAEEIAPMEVVDHDVGATFDLDAAIAEATRAAQTAFDPIDTNPMTFDDLSAFLTDNISKAAEKAKEPFVESELPSDLTSVTESASRATMLALQTIQQNKYHPTALPQSSSHAQSPSNHQHYNTQPQTAQGNQPYYQYQQQPSSNQQQPQRDANGQLPPHQTDSTPALYERARQAAAARSSTHARREGSHSTRRPWSSDEEKALMMGLDMVKGPHWSQILSLFGPNGSISNILADRTQVQLKDKARNLKLFFLKTNSEMPYYLQCVTGELKTRAPTQAARKEAEEKARMNSDEHQAHMNGILALAGGLQNGQGVKQNVSTTMPRNNTPNQAYTHTGSHPGSHPGTPRVQQASQPMPIPPIASARPVIPAPQPVSLPKLVTSKSSSLQHNSQQSTTPQLPQSTAKPEYHHPVVKQEHGEEPALTSLAEKTQPENDGLSSEDAALLGLKAAMEGESAAAASAAAAAIAAATAVSSPHGQGHTEAMGGSEVSGTVNANPNPQENGPSSS